MSLSYYPFIHTIQLFSNGKTYKIYFYHKNFVRANVSATAAPQTKEKGLSLSKRKVHEKKVFFTLFVCNWVTYFFHPVILEKIG